MFRPQNNYVSLCFATKTITECIVEDCKYTGQITAQLPFLVLMPQLCKKENIFVEKRKNYGNENILKGVTKH